MSFSRSTPQFSGPGGSPSSSPPSEDAGFQPPRGKRLRLEEPSSVSEGMWGLLSVPRLSEAEKAWQLPPRPCKAFLVPTIFDNPADSCVEKSVSGEQICDLECQNSVFQANSSLQSVSSRRFDSGLKTSGTFSEAGLQDREVSCVACADRFEAEVSQFLSNTSMRDTHEVKDKNGKQYLVRGGDSNLKSSSYTRQTESPFLDVNFYKEIKPTFHKIKKICKVDNMIPSSKKESDVSLPMLKIPNSQNQLRLKIAKSSYFRDSVTISIPEFPTDLNSNLSFVYLKKIAKKKNDKSEAYARDFTNIYWFQNRHDLEKQKLQDGEKIVEAENIFPEYYESNYQLSSNQNVFEKREDLISLYYCVHSNIKCDVRGSKKNFTLKLENVSRKESKTSLDSYIFIRLGKSKCLGYKVVHILKRNWQNCWIMETFKTNCENMGRPEEKLTLLEIQKTDILYREDYNNTKVMSVYQQQSKALMVEMLGNQKILIIWLNSKEDNNNMLHLRYCIVQKDCHLSNIFQVFIREILYFHESITEGQKDNSLIYKILKCGKQIDVQNITASINVTIKNGILSKDLQTSVSEHLHNNFDFSVRMQSDSELGEGNVFKWIEHLNYTKIVAVANHISYLMRIFTFPRLLEKYMKPPLRKRKLFKTQQDPERFKKRIFDCCRTTKNLCFPNFVTYEENPILVGFNSMEKTYLIKESSNNNLSCLEKFTNMKNSSENSFSTVKIQVKYDPQLTQDNCEHISDKYCDYYERDMHKQDLDIDRKQSHKKTSSFNSKHIFGNSFNVKQQATLASPNVVQSEQINTMAIQPVLKFENLQSELERSKCDVDLKKEVKVTTQSSTNSCQVHINIEKEDVFFSIDGMLSMQTVSLMSKKVNVKETKSVNINKIADRNEYESKLEESELANSYHFHPKNDSTLYVNSQFETDSNRGKNECFQDLTAKCLSVENLAIVKDSGMKKKFDLVLEELHMFHEISRENKNPSTMEANNKEQSYFGINNDVEEAKMAVERDVKMATPMKICGSPLSSDATAGPNMRRRHQALFKWKIGHNTGEQEVPNEYCCPKTSREELPFSPSQEDGQRLLPDRSASFPEEHKEEKFKYLSRGGSHFSHGISRIQPLKTCSRPIRIGLSRKARLKQLHPYLK